MFWNMPPPFGVAGLSRHTLIDVDEAGIQLKYANRKHGKAPIGVEVIQNGLYGHRDKFTLICAIDTTGCLHYRFEKEAGTTIEIFNRFVGQVFNIYLSAHPPRRLMYDNLLSHLNPIVINTIHASDHDFIQRAPYNPRDGPIEYFFSMLPQELTHRMYKIKNDNDL
jgi:hypothetical protein